MKKMAVVAVLALGLVLMSIPAFATPVSEFSTVANGWTMLADDDGVGNNGFVDPGWGGQDFDAEYLFYKYNDSTKMLSIGLQTGFDVDTGKQGNYYAGDLALSFDGCKTYWEYGVDFGYTEQNGYSGASVGALANGTGLYKVTEWNNDVYFHVADPFAIKSGSIIDDDVASGGHFSTVAGRETVSGDLSYWRTVSFSVAGISGFTVDNVDAHWTMSCGNDVIESCSPVPEPQTLLLMGIGLLGLAFVGRKKLGERA